MSYPLPQALLESLASSQGQRLVIMTCGVAGSGKSTLARTLCTLHPNFLRFSIDQYIFTHHGLSGIDCPVPQYARNQDEAKTALKSQFREILRAGRRDVILDFSFWNREYRDEWKAIVREEMSSCGNYGERFKVVLVFFDAEEEVLWRRIEERRLKAETKGRDADDAAVVTRAMLDRFVRGFERPDDDEEAIVIKIE